MTKVLTLRDVPDTLVEALRARAKRNRRSMQRELLSIVEAVVVDRGHALADMAEVRRQLTTPMSLDEIHATMDEGRP